MSKKLCPIQLYTVCVCDSTSSRLDGLEQDDATKVSQSWGGGRDIPTYTSHGSRWDGRRHWGGNASLEPTAAFIRLATAGSTEHVKMLPQNLSSLACIV